LPSIASSGKSSCSARSGSVDYFIRQHPAVELLAESPPGMISLFENRQAVRQTGLFV
jgi:hypothetical protein